MPRYTETNVNITDEQVALKESVHKFCEEVLRPASLALDRLPDPEDVIAKDSVFWHAMRKAYELGYHAAVIPQEHGGRGLGALETHIFLEELGWASAEFAIALGAAAFPFLAAANSTDEDLLQHLVKPFAADKAARYIGCWAITEPEHGSDSLMPGTKEFGDPGVCFQTRARRDGDHWIINGQKSSWVSNGIIATHALTFLTIDASKGMNGGGVAIIPLDLPGVSRGHPLDKLGQRALNQGEIVFDGVRIPQNYMIAQPDLYPIMMSATLALANAAIGTMFTGVARAAYEEALDYCKVRIQGGKPICEHQWIQQKLFEMFTKVESARALSRAAMIYNTAALIPVLELSIASKVHCTKVAFEVAHDAVQLFGSYGLSKGYTVEKLFRDARSSLIADGCNEVLALAAAQALLSTH